jgi:hypothetical protein
VNRLHFINFLYNCFPRYFKILRILSCLKINLHQIILLVFSSFNSNILIISENKNFLIRSNKYHRLAIEYISQVQLYFSKVRFLILKIEEFKGIIVPIFLILSKHYIEDVIKNQTRVVNSFID